MIIQKSLFVVARIDDIMLVIFEVNSKHIVCVGQMSFVTLCSADVILSFLWSAFIHCFSFPCLQWTTSLKSLCDSLYWSSNRYLQKEISIFR